MKALLSHDQTAIWPRLCLRDDFWPRKKWESVAQMQQFPVILSLTAVGFTGVNYALTSINYSDDLLCVMTIISCIVK